MVNNRNEPSMDEILSTIKKIIADEDRAKAGPKAKSPPPGAKRDSDEILELTEAEEAEAESLLDANKAQNLARSFSTLQTLSEPGAAPQIVKSGETSLEGLVREMMKPMLKQWLDTNLPVIVESMVEREIARITKKG
ncbi:DUF2497 domain-containing protein [Sphingorhabdus arenilitoris]|uniref:DUF2497 domain-containing protein n=1 Tax=Sphingorhabdus arenilitoris TaxID=1490041 RepID=A0ABV8RDZ7_9SPHN